MQSIKKFWSGFDRVLEIMANAGMVILFRMMIAVCWEVFSRYLLGRGTLWVIELSEYGLLFMTFLGTAWVLRNEGHVEMDIVIAALQPKTRRSLRLVTSIACAIVCLSLAWSGADVALDYFQRDLHRPTLMEPLASPIFAIMPIGFFLLFVQFVRRAQDALLVENSKEENDRLHA